ncbi:MAG: error-prone DNA polymerase [Proteobacteria bacterium]|nr:error-prone DNA polymerase [Pseudomonadota bacterium]
MNAATCGGAPPAYAELHCVSNFTFLRGASHPQELVEQAEALGYEALAITDECSVAGVVRAHAAARGRRVRLIVGAEFTLECGLKFTALARDRSGYGGLCRFITLGRRAAGKGHYRLTRTDLAAAQFDRCLLLWLPGPQPQAQELQWLAENFGGRLHVAVELLRDGGDRARLAALQRLGERFTVPLVASGGALMHVRARRQLQDALTAIRLGVPIAQAGRRLHANGERYLRERERLARLYPPPLLAATVGLARQCRFSLDELRYEYPRELVPPGQTPASHLRRLTLEGAQRRWPHGLPQAEHDGIEHELALIAELGYEPYFLTVHDIVAFARGRGILCQGRGSAANSRVCYYLGITAVDPQRGATMLFERFISRERREPPDIDVDFEHERREEVLQYVYGKYGRERAALAATVIAYRPRSALRDLARAFGLEAREGLRLAKAMQWWDGSAMLGERLAQAGFDLRSPALQHLLPLVAVLVAPPGFPRHLSQHVGGFVIAAGLLAELVPIENAAMPERTVVQWDKDDLNELGLLKVDLLALGMLTALRRAFDLVHAYRGIHHTLGMLPAEDAEVYRMISRADTVGVFQIESRAQMAMLPRLQPRCYFDLVIEVAIVRPGPIQGGMVHPYLRRRSGAEQVDYPREEIRAVLQPTLGVPIFQEQVMQIAVVAAGFTPGEADALRRAMGAWKRTGGLEGFRERLLSGMRARNYPQEFAERIYQQMTGFGEYGFPQSHAMSFALLVYDSAWLKHHEPAAFACALLNSQPMGFYAPAQLVRDARAHGVEVRPVDACVSDWDCALEHGADGEPVLRLGLCLVKSLPQASVTRLVAARAARPFASVADLAARAGLTRTDLEALAAAGAFATLCGNRHLAFWEVAGTETALPLLPAQAGNEVIEGRPLIPAPREGEGVVADYASIGLTLGRHPLALLRGRLGASRLMSAAQLLQAGHGAQVRTAGLVLMRQRPQTASGVTFLTLEDESGQVNVIVWQRVGDAQRRALLEARLMEVHGEMQQQDGVTHLIAHRLLDRSQLLGGLLTRSRDFH